MHHLLYIVYTIDASSVGIHKENSLVYLIYLLVIPTVLYSLAKPVEILCIPLVNGWGVLGLGLYQVILCTSDCVQMSVHVISHSISYPISNYTLYI